MSREVPGNGVDSVSAAPSEKTVLRNLDTGETHHLMVESGPNKSPVSYEEASENSKDFLKSLAGAGNPLPRPRAGRAKSDIGGSPPTGTGLSGLLAAAENPRRALPYVPAKVGAHRKARHDFKSLRRYQCFRAHSGPVRTLSISPSGKYLASAGADGIVNVYSIVSHPLESDDVSRSSSAELLVADHGVRTSPYGQRAHRPLRGRRPVQQDSLFLQGSDTDFELDGAVCPPLASFKDHTQDVVDLSWSKNDFLLSASLDKTMRLWHPTSAACLRRFLHTDLVTSVTFHPEDEQICVSGTANGTLRLWHLKERKLLSETHTDEVITATTISPNGMTLLAGTVMGRCKFYGLFDEIQGEWQLVHTTQMDVRSARGKNKAPAKISGIMFNAHDPNEFIVSSNDSRIRLYRMDDKSVVYKYVGHACSETQLKASVSPCGRFILSGSESKHVFIWEVDDQPEYPVLSKGKAHDDHSVSSKRDRNISHESFLPHEGDSVTAALFAPTYFYPRRDAKDPQPGSSRSSGLTIVTASLAGEICVFVCL